MAIKELRSAGTVNQWGKGLAVRLPKAVANAAGLKEGSPIRLLAAPGRLVIEVVDRKPTLEEMLAAFDPERHAGEAMALPPVGREVRRASP